MKLKELRSAALELSGERGIPKEEIMQTIALALAAAYKKEYGDKEEKIQGIFDEKSDVFKLYSKKLVVEAKMLKNPEEAKENARESVVRLDKTLPIVLEKEEEVKEPITIGADEEQEELIRFRPQRHILLKEAKKINKEAKPGDLLLFPLEIQEEYGRIAAQTAKQVITQRLRELERNLAFSAAKEREGEIVSGIIQRIEKNIVYIDMGKAVGALSPQDQLPQEYYPIGRRIKVYVSKVQPSPKGPSISLSRASQEALIQMFTQEVPEIASRVVEIKAVAREAGSRSKIAVSSNDPDIDPIGSCVGQKGTRISIIINEFGGEKIDIIPYAKDTARFIANALAPAKTLSVELTDEASKQAVAYVNADQQSLAIGKKGQNVRLAVKLTGWKIDVKLLYSSSKEKEI